MRKFFVTTFVLAAMLCLATSGLALEKVAVLDVDRSDDWNAGTTCTVSYWNVCTGWLWNWTGFGDDAKVGNVFDACCGQNESVGLVQAILDVVGAPSDYGFTGTLAAHAADANNCPTGPALASAVFLPFVRNQVVPFAGEIVPSKFVLVATLQEDMGFPSPAGILTEHPAAGPTGPQACGTCYPTDRVNRSFFYGTTGSPLCPGSSFNDGVCDAQLIWTVFLTCGPISVEESSWGSIKNLYR